MSEEGIIPCSLSKEAKQKIDDYARALVESAPRIGSHGLTEDEFVRSGLLHAAIEKLRGSRSASMGEKRGFIAEVLDWMKEQGDLEAWEFAGGGERHDYQVELAGATTCIEAKGCLDGNNTNIFVRPPNADHFLMWSLCQNMGADPRHNVWSGIHTRLGAEIIAKKERIDGLIVWDMLCGTVGRPCPKLGGGKAPVMMAGRPVPPPCIYLFPRSLPDARNNPEPPVWKLDEIPFLQRLHARFGGGGLPVNEVKLRVKREGNEVLRETTIQRGESILRQSRWTVLKRANV